MSNSIDNLPDGVNQNRIPVQGGLFVLPTEKGHQPALLANTCRHCGKNFFPKRTLCPFCFEQGRLEDIALDSRGVIYAVTVVHISSPSGIKAPYAYGYVDIPANNIRVFALFTGDAPNSFQAGMEVELVLEPVRTNSRGQQIIGYKFKPAK
ncbi:MAG: benzoylsuccinyl-CoA thiolase [bacterium]|nr:benzoylsuccinyl-CoA thiolase [bacterium]